MSEKKALLDAKEVGEQVGLHPRTVLALAREKRIPRVKVARNVVRFDLNDVIEALKKGDSKK